MKQSILDFETREFRFTRQLTNDELASLIDEMKQRGYDFEHSDNVAHIYAFTKFKR